MSSSNGFHPRGEMDQNQPKEPDYYAALGVKVNASEREIKQAFRRLAKLWHPDHFTTAAPDLRARAERRMQSLNRAYTVLSDPVKKVSYDQRRLHSDEWTYETATWPEAAYGQAAGDFEDSFLYQRSGNAGRNPSQTSVNLNGAGMLGGTLCLILALGTLWRISVDGVVDGLAPVLTFAALVGLLILAGYLFDARSPVARAVRRFLDYDPRQGWYKFALRHHQTSWQSGQYAAGSTDSSSTSAPSTAFEQLVDEALADIPAEFHIYLENVVVRVKPDPSPEEIKRMKVRPCNLLLGLYEGIPLTHQGARGHPPEVITIFQHSIEAYCHDDPDRMRYQVRAAVFHELAHHFGLSHEEMPAWVK
jgi:curved DNA-binding protein CbpA/predicted Zn-dependent protease with MMP-like domain